MKQFNDFITGRCIRGLLIHVSMLITVSLAAQPDWDFNINDYGNSTQVYAEVHMDGTAVTSGYFGAFVGNECRGYVEAVLFPPTGSHIFNFLVYSNQTSGEILTFRYYDDIGLREYTIHETAEFVVNQSIGDSDYTPAVFNTIDNAAPVASCPDKAGIAVDQGPVTFDLCAIFSDPDSDPLTLDAVCSANASLQWLSACEVEFTAAADGVSTLTLSASDGQLQSECSYTFTLSSSNSSPEVASPIGQVILDEGFTVFDIDLDTVFNDPEGDVLTYSAVSADGGIAGASVAGSMLSILETGTGNTTVNLTAADAEFSVEETFSVVVRTAGPPLPWQLDPQNFLYSGEINAVVRINGDHATTGMLGAFVGGTCRGMAEGIYFPPLDLTLFSLLVYSNTASGDILTFRYYDMVYQTVHTVDEVIDFKPDMVLGSALSPVELNITSSNRMPSIDAPIADRSVNEGFTSIVLDLSTVFSDPDADPLEYSAVSSDPSVAGTEVSGTQLTVSEAGTGDCMIRVRTGDGTFAAVDRFNLSVANVNDPPEVIKPVEDQSLQEGFGTRMINISGTFADPDNDVLTYAVTSSDTEVVTASISGAFLVIVESGPGDATLSLCVDDGEYEICDEITVSVADVNLVPEADCSLLPDTSMVEGDGTFTIDLCSVFSDPDEDALTYSVALSDDAVATANTDGCSLQLTEVSNGTTTVTVCASDGSLETCCAFDFSIIERNELEVYLMDDLLSDGDSIKGCEAEETMVLVVYSDVEWAIGSEDNWISAVKTNNFNAEIVISENESGSVRTGSITIADVQDNELSLVVYQDVCSSAKVSGVSDFEVNFYPNPVDEELIIEIINAKSGDLLNIELISLDGKNVLVNDLVHPNSGTVRMDMQGVDPGMYFIRISRSASGNLVLPVMKK